MGEKQKWITFLEWGVVNMVWKGKGKSQQKTLGQEFCKLSTNNCINSILRVCKFLPDEKWQKY